MFLPAHLEEYIPGSPLSPSIHKPESSAKDVWFDKFLAFLAFINAFCAKFFPSSIGSTLEKIEIGKALTLMSFKRIFISFTFPGL